MGFPAVLIRTSTERPEVLDMGTIVIGGITEREIIQSINLYRAMWGKDNRILIPQDYRDNNVSLKVVKVIQSYTNIIEKNTWRKKSC